MSNRISNIKDTEYDSVVNELIDFVNSQNDNRFRAHAVAAIGKFLIEKHVIDVGSSWVQKTMPLVEGIKVTDNMVDNIYYILNNRINKIKSRGFHGIFKFISDIFKAKTRR